MHISFVRHALWRFPSSFSASCLGPGQYTDIDTQYFITIARFWSIYLPDLHEVFSQGFRSVCEVMATAVMLLCVLQTAEMPLTFIVRRPETHSTVIILRPPSPIYNRSLIGH
jgi:hypothetical protein